MIYVSGAAHKALQEMVRAEKADELEDACILCERLECWLGPRRTSWQTVYKLLRLGAVSMESAGKGTHYFNLNETGRRLEADPTWEPGIVAAQRSRLCDCSPERRQPTRYGTCDNCMRSLK